LRKSCVIIYETPASQEKEKKKRERAASEPLTTDGTTGTTNHSLLAAFGPTTLHMAKTIELATKGGEGQKELGHCDCDWDFCIVINCLICIINNRVKLLSQS